MQLANFIGSRILQHDTARVCAPPGKITGNGRRNIIVATPTRSGTHLVIDLIANSIPAYRRNPLYISLDSMDPLGSPGQPALLDTGYVIKTHYPSNKRRHPREKITELAQGSLVIVVHRPADEIRRSLERWVADEPDLHTLRRQLERLDDEIAEFEVFWRDFSPYVIEFRDLFDPVRAQAIVADIARLTSSEVRAGAAGSVPVARPALVYINKALTRLLGRLAPRVDTTIRALR
jgi:hypothetical protein